MKRKIFILLLLSCSLLYCQPTSAVQSNLTDIENYAINIENNSLQQKMQIESLKIELEESQKLLEESENSVIEMSQMQKELLKQLKNSETKCMNLKVALVVSISLSIISIGTLVIAMKG